jgi:hypothetical protein
MFDFKNIRFYCEVSQKFYCKNCSMTMYVYNTYESEEKDRPVCRSIEVQENITVREASLKTAIDTFDFDEIDKNIRECDNIDIDAKLRRQAETLHLKLENELAIDNFLRTHQSHENYKDIRKDVQKINDMLDHAQENQIEIDNVLSTKVNEYTSTIISERNLRKQRDLFLDQISTCDQDKVDKLQNLIDIANKNLVDK